MKLGKQGFLFAAETLFPQQEGESCSIVGSYPEQITENWPPLPGLVVEPFTHNLMILGSITAQYSIV